MIEKLLANLIPVMFAKLATISSEDKITFARFLSSLCDAYINDQKEYFVALLSKTNIDPTWQASIVGALWK